MGPVKGHIYQGGGGKGGARGASCKGKGKGYYGGDPSMWDALARQDGSRAEGSGGGTPPLPVGP
eukprot:1935505-Pyramimonas_sp.AAC.1